MTQALTDADGRVRDLLERPLQAGDYRLEFDVAHEDGSFFTKIAVDLRITDVERSYHVPLLLAPYRDDDLSRVVGDPGRARLAQDGEPVDVDARPARGPRHEQLHGVHARHRPCPVEQHDPRSRGRAVKVDGRDVHAVDVHLGLAARRALPADDRDRPGRRA